MRWLRNIDARLVAHDMENDSLPLPPARCLSKEEAARYLGIGVTLLESLGVPVIKIGRRAVYDVVDLDAWLEEYKRCGRVMKETLWPEKSASTNAPIASTGGSMPRSLTASAYAKVLGLKA